MPLSVIRESDSEPLNRTVKLRFSHRQLERLDAVAAELGMARSWVLREAVALGLPAFLEKVRGLRDAGQVPRAGSAQARGSMLLSGAAAGDDVRGRDRACGRREPVAGSVRTDPGAADAVGEVGGCVTP